MNIKLVLFTTACLSYFMIPAGGVNLLAAASAGNGIVFAEGLAGTNSVHPVLIHAKPPPQLVIDHKPVTLVPVATIPTYGFVDRLVQLWGGISDSIGTKIKAVGDFFRGPPKVVLVNVQTTTTQKPTTTKKPHLPPVVVEIGVPHHRVYPIGVPMPVPLVLEDCGTKTGCT